MFLRHLAVVSGLVSDCFLRQALNSSLFASLQMLCNRETEIMKAKTAKEKAPQKVSFC